MAAFLNALKEEGTKQDCLDMCAQLWEENCALRAKLAWQPIETAPKDGTEILGCWLPSLVCGVVSWGFGEWAEADERVRAPTHWMPLPEPPDAET